MTTVAEDLYSTLGVKPDAAQEQIAKRYRKLASQLHPDKPTGDKDAFKQVALAYEVLGDPDRRKRYDETGYSDPVQNLTIQELNQQLGRVLLKAISEGRDPEKMDLLGMIHSTIHAEKNAIKAQIKENTKRAEKLRKVAERFTSQDSENLLARMTLFPAIELEKSVQQDEQKLETLDKVAEILKKYKYKHDPGQEMPSSLQIVMGRMNSGTGWVKFTTGDGSTQ